MGPMSSAPGAGAAHVTSRLAVGSTGWVIGSTGWRRDCCTAGLLMEQPRDRPHGHRSRGRCQEGRSVYAGRRRSTRCRDHHGEDMTTEPIRHETYTHGHAAATVRQHAQRTAEEAAAFLLPELRPGVSILDVGCGPGSITRGLAERVAPGPVVGLDLSRDTLETARAD